MSKKILIPLAQGFEEAELSGIISPLRRAGFEVTIASLSEELVVVSSNGLKVVADTTLSKFDASNLDAVVLPGGLEGMENLKKDPRVLEIIRKQHGKHIAAICASPVVLNEAGVLEGEFTCYPGFEKGLNGRRLDKAVVVNKKVITGAGPATAILFGLEIVRQLAGEESYNQLKDGLLVPLVVSHIA